MSFENINTYSGNSVTITSNRLIFNTNKDNLFLISSKDIIFSSYGEIHMNVGPRDYTKKDIKFVLNAPRIEMGLSSKGYLEPIAKGEKTEDILNSILNSLSSFTNSLKTATGTGVGTINLLQVNAAADKLSVELKQIQKNVEKIKSETTYSI